MKNAFNFSGKEKSEQVIVSTWEDFRNSLAAGKFAYDQTDLALGETFLKVFDDLFSKTEAFFLVCLEELVKTNTQLFRGAKLNPSESVNYDRFIPKKEYIKEDNRFSPPGIEWLYLAIQSPTKLPDDCYTSAEECCIKECRALPGERFALCEFVIDDAYKNKKIVNLTISADHTFDDLNYELEACGQQYKDNLKEELISQGRESKAIREDFENALKKWATFTYAKLMSEQLFTPLTTDDKQLTYAPFQCLAKYFITRGYDGIIYTSTVCSNAKNIVLFDKHFAMPIGNIKDFII